MCVSIHTRKNRTRGSKECITRVYVCRVMCGVGGVGGGSKKI